MEVRIRHLGTLRGPNAQLRFRIHPGEFGRFRAHDGVEVTVPIPVGEIQFDAETLPGLQMRVFPIEAWAMDEKQCFLRDFVWKQMLPVLRAMWEDMLQKYPDATLEGAWPVMTDVIFKTIFGMEPPSRIRNRNEYRARSVDVVQSVMERFKLRLMAKDGAA